MKRAIVFVLVLCASPAAAEQAPAVTPAQRTERQPVIRYSLAGDFAPQAIAQEQPIVVRAVGNGATVLRPMWFLDGAFSVAATFEASDPTAVYGVTLGGADRTAFLVRADGAFSMQSLANGELSGGAWAPVGLRTLERDLTTANRLEVRVTPQQVAFLINGQIVNKAPIAGQLDGLPGIHVGVGSEVAVAAFTVKSAQSPLTQVGGK